MSGERLKDIAWFMAEARKWQGWAERSRQVGDVDQFHYFASRAYGINDRHPGACRLYEKALAMKSKTEQRYRGWSAAFPRMLYGGGGGLFWYNGNSRLLHGFSKQPDFAGYVR
ncbi:MAG: hypothetical protein A3G34_08730 [Candidatus Lindowbacteria bacterium RIFCSPLOWO2_12_FULL_62_27]|nr:MAG: hypothetical protein A3G34_08730 [Candidatus Lindowbacteria bacterium RIFCSPLOWO2_12_FULL_62_27]